MPRWCLLLLRMPRDRSEEYASKVRNNLPLCYSGIPYAANLQKHSSYLWHVQFVHLQFLAWHIYECIYCDQLGWLLFLFHHILLLFLLSSNVCNLSRSLCLVDLSAPKGLSNTGITMVSYWVWMKTILCVIDQLSIENMQQLCNTEGQKVDSERLALDTRIKIGKRFDIDLLHDVTP